MVTIQLDAMLREFLPARSVRLEADNVDRVFDVLEERFPKLRHRLRDETGTVRRFIHVFVNGQDIGNLDGLSTPLGDADTVHILHSIQGG